MVPRDHEQLVRAALWPACSNRRHPLAKGAGEVSEVMEALATGGWLCWLSGGDFRSALEARPGQQATNLGLAVAAVATERAQ